MPPEKGTVIRPLSTGPNPIDARARATSRAQAGAQSIRGRAHGRTFDCRSRRAIVDGRRSGSNEPLPFDEASGESDPGDAPRAGITPCFAACRDKGVRGCRRNLGPRENTPRGRGAPITEGLRSEIRRSVRGLAARGNPAPRAAKSKLEARRQTRLHSIASPSGLRPRWVRGSCRPRRKPRWAVIRESSGPQGARVVRSVAEVG